MVKNVSPTIEKEGRDLALALDSTGYFDVFAALWNYESAEERWRLVLITPSVITKGPAAIYRALQNIISEIPNLSFEAEDIRVLMPNSDIALQYMVTAISVPKPGPEGSAPRISNSWFNGHLVEDAILLWSPSTGKSAEIKKES